MNQTAIDQKIDEILGREDRYDRAAYKFVAQAVTFTVGRLPAHRHVSALELLYGLRDFARQEYGPMAALVLNAWGAEERLRCRPDRLSADRRQTAFRVSGG